MTTNSYCWMGFVTSDTNRTTSHSQRSHLVRHKEYRVALPELRSRERPVGEGGDERAPTEVDAGLREHHVHRDQRSLVVVARLCEPPPGAVLVALDRAEVQRRAGPAVEELPVLGVRILDGLAKLVAQMRQVRLEEPVRVQEACAPRAALEQLVGDPPLDDANALLLLGLCHDREQLLDLAVAHEPSQMHHLGVLRFGAQHQAEPAATLEFQRFLDASSALGQGQRPDCLAASKRISNRSQLEAAHARVELAPLIFSTAKCAPNQAQRDDS